MKNLQVSDSGPLWPSCFQKLGKLSQNLSSAAVVIGSLRVNPYPANMFCLENVVCFLCLLHIFKCILD